VFIVSDDDTCYYCQEEDWESDKSHCVSDDEVDETGMIKDCGFVSARPSSSTPEDPRTGQELLASKDVETYEGFNGMKGKRPHSGVVQCQIHSIRYT
jgi:hypothetical protein